MHAMWKGTLQIAKIQIPIKLYAATEDKEIALKTLHAACGGALSHLKYCRACEEKVEPEDVRKAYDLGGGNYVELTEEELEGIAPPASKTLFIEQFADESDVARIRLKKHYYVGSDELGDETFRLLHAGLLRTNKAGIGYITLRSAQSLAALWPTPEGLVLSTMLYEDELRPMERIASAGNRAHAPISENHLFVFRQLIDAMSSPFVGTKYPNKYDTALRALLENKMTKLAPQQRAREEPAVKRENHLGDLLTNLTASLEMAQNGDDSFAPSGDDSLPH
ncbi:Ku protein [Cohnella cellulosilytica]